MDEDELLDDGEALAGLEPAGAPRDVPHNFEYDLRFPVQDHKIGPGTWVDPGDRRGTSTSARSTTRAARSSCGAARRARASRCRAR